MNDLFEILRTSGRLGTGWGFAIMILGVLSIMAPFVSGLAATSLVAILLTGAGIAMTVYAFKAGSVGRGVLQFIFGGITVVAGVAMYLTPEFSMLTLTGVLLAYFIVDGAYTLYTGFKARSQSGSGWVIVSGLASIALAVMLYMDWPYSGVYAIGVLVGVRLIFSGLSIAMLGFIGDASVDAIEEDVDNLAKSAS